MGNFCVLCACLFLLCWNPVNTQDSPIYRVDPSLMEEEIKSITESTLKRQAMQNHLDTLSYDRRNLQGDALLNMLSSAFSAKFQSRVSVVRNLRDAVVSAYSQSAPSVGHCCDVSDSNLEYDSAFKTEVSTSKVCELVSSNAAANAARLQNAFRDACVNNLRSVSSLKWQYFGSEQGVTTQFPATKANDCGSYDNRFRPWYVQTNVPKAKQVVVVLDKSGSMQQTYNGISYMNLAKTAVKTVIDTLNPYDMFGVVVFSSTASSYLSRFPNGECFSEKLAQATPQNKRWVKAYVDTINYGGNTMYSNALNRAFEYYETSWHRALQAERVLLFMSDGSPSDSRTQIMATLQQRNNALNNSVVVMTYGLGTGIDFSVLRDMASATSAHVESEDKAGIFTNIGNPSQLRNEMASYYSFFSSRSQVTNDPLWTVPYLDSWGLGLMVTAALPVHAGGSLVGVTAVDITIEELLAESSYFKPTELSYTFVINQGGLVINHPLFPYVSDREPLFVEATAFERDAEFLSVFESMKSGGSGTSTFISTRILPQGDSKKYGIRTVRVQSTYRWKQIPGTTFSLCLVLADGDTQTVLQPLGHLPAGSFQYHRLDLMPPSNPADQCQHVNSFSVKGKSAVAFAARSFEDAELYLSGKMSANDARNIANYMEGTSAINPSIKDGVKDAVVATYKADELWRSTEDENLTAHVFWRYVATKEGIFRVFPGTEMPYKYDPVVRGWYENAQANRDKYVVTPPYEDAASRISVVTISRALFEGGSVDYTLRDKLVGAMGVDIITTYFHELLLNIYPLCEDTTKFRCLLLDQAGFVIMSDQFITNPTATTDKHVAEIEPEIANVLIEERVLLPRTCSHIDRALVQRTFEIAGNQTRYTGTTAYPGCHLFQLIPVGGTNVHLVILDKDWHNCGSSHQTACYCNHFSSTAFASCDQHTERSCECPCTSHATSFFPCENIYNYTRTTPHPCTPEAVDEILTLNPRTDVRSLPPCYNLSFQYIPADDNSIDAPEEENEEGLHPAVIAAIVFGVVAGIAMLYKKKKKPNNATQTTEADPYPNQQNQPPKPSAPQAPPPQNPQYGYKYPSSVPPQSNVPPQQNHSYLYGNSPAMYPDTKGAAPPSYNVAHHY